MAYDGSLLFDTKINTDGMVKGLGSLGGIAKTALVGTVAAIGAVTAGLTAAAFAGVKYNSQMEQYATSFKTMLGSASSATEMISGLKKFAADTPFEFTDLAKGTQTLLAFGVSSESVMPTLKQLGDVSQGNTERFNALTLAFAQVSSAGKLSGQDLLQMVNAGFNPLQVMSEKTGKSMAVLRGEMEKGAISSADVAQAFKDATSEGGKFFNAMQDQSKTFNGQLSTLKDNSMQFLGALTKGLQEELKDTALPLVNGYMTQLSDAFEKGGIDGVVGSAGTVLADAFKEIARQAPGVIELSTSLISSFVDGISDNSDVIADAAVDIVDGLADAVVKLAPKLFDAATQLVVEMVRALSGDELANSVLQIADTLKTFLGNAFTVVTGAVQTLLPFLTELVNIITPFTPVIIAAVGAWKAANLVIAGYETAVKLAAAAQAALNFVMDANPAVLLVSALAALAGGIALYSLATDKASDKTKETIKQLDDLKKSHEDARKQIDETAKSDMVQAEKVKALTDELYKLDDQLKSGKLTGEDANTVKEKMKWIVGELNKAIPDLKLALDKETGAVTNQKTEVYKLTDAYVNMIKAKANANAYSKKLEDATLERIDLEEKKNNTPKTLTETVNKKLPANQNPLPFPLDQMFPIILPEEKEVSNPAYVKAKKYYDEAKAREDKYLAEAAKYGEEYASYNQPSTTPPPGGGAGSGSGTGGGYGYGTGSTSSTTSKAPTMEDLGKAEIDDLKWIHDMKLQSDQEYYDSLAVLRDAYFEVGSDGWQDYTLEIQKYHEQQAEDAAELNKKSMASMLSDLEKRVNDGEVIEDKYYQDLEYTRDLYFTKDSEEWIAATKAINDIKTKAAEQARKKELDDLNYSHDIGQKSDEEYYAELKKYRDKYFEKGSDDWKKYTSTIISYEKGVVQALYNDVNTFADKALGEVQQKVDALASKIKSYGGLTEDITFTKDDGTQGGFTRFNDPKDEIATLKEYKANLDIIKARMQEMGVSGDDIKAFMSNVTSMSIEEGSALAKNLASTGEYFNTFINGWIEKNNLANKFAEEFYSDETTEALDKVKSYAVEKATEAGVAFSDEFLKSGTTSAENFIKSFGEEIDRQINTIVEKGGALAPGAITVSVGVSNPAGQIDATVPGSAEQGQPPISEESQQAVEETQTVLETIPDQFETDFKGSVDNVTAYMRAELERAGLEIPEGFFTAGTNSAKNFGEAFLQELTAQLLVARAVVEAFGSSISPGSGSVVNSYNTTTTNYIFEESGETVTEQLQSAKAFDELGRMRNG